MADKVEITDPYKFDPGLKDKSLKQLQIEIDFRLAVIEEKKREQERKDVESLVAQVNEAQDGILKSLNFLYEQSVLPEAIVTAYTTVGGSFAPHLKHRHVDADRLLAIRAAKKAEAEGKPAKVKRTRKPKN